MNLGWASLTRRLGFDFALAVHWYKHTLGYANLLFFFFFFLARLPASLAACLSLLES